MNNGKLIEPIGYIVAAIAFLFCLILFYKDTKVFMGSFSAALMAAALAWMTYIGVRLVVLAIRK